MENMFANSCQQNSQAFSPRVINPTHINSHSNENQFSLENLTKTDYETFNWSLALPIYDNILQQLPAVLSPLDAQSHQQYSKDSLSCDSANVASTTFCLPAWTGPAAAASFPIPPQPSLIPEQIFDSDHILKDLLTPPESPPHLNEDYLLMDFIKDMEPIDWDTLNLDFQDEPMLLSFGETFLSSPMPEESSTSGTEEYSSDSGFSDGFVSPSSNSAYGESPLDHSEISAQNHPRSIAEYETSSPASTEMDSVKMETKRKRRPYRKKKSEEERKLRKKEQNKTAAIRYRIKKRLEVEVYLEEEKELMTKNTELKAHAVELGRELKYLKTFMRDMFRKKGLLK